MIVYGVLLIATESIGLAFSIPLGLHHWVPMSGMSHGLLMIAAALACAQGRRSLRLTGIYVGMFIPVGIALILLWDALQARNNSNTLTSILLGISGLLSFGFVALFYRLRPQEGVESRGYAVTLPRQSARPAMMIEPSPQSKAG
jgi:hypothetical protein